MKDEELSTLSNLEIISLTMQLPHNEAVFSIITLHIVNFNDRNGSAPRRKNTCNIQKNLMLPTLNMTVRGGGTLVKESNSYLLIWGIERV